MAADGSLTAAQEAEFTTQASAVGMTPEAIDTALAKLEAGLLPDSYLAEARPIRTETRKDGYTITDVSYFEDGSINTLRYPDLEEMTAAVERGDTAAPARAGASGCKYFYTSVAISWTNCVIEGSSAGVSLAYRVDASMARGHSAMLTRAYDKQAGSFGGSLSHVSFGLVGSTAAQYQVMFTTYLGFASYTRTLTTQIASGGGLAVKMY